MTALAMVDLSGEYAKKVESVAHIVYDDPDLLYTSMMWKSEQRFYLCG